jgi:deoxyadenosine/deoxycytidine kinase
MFDYKYIAIEGNIGSGKTSLSKMIADQHNAHLILERFEDNSFLPKFYKDPARYAFPLEMSFLADRFQQLKDNLTQPDLFRSFTIADYFIDKSLIFAKHNLKGDEIILYSRLFHIINSSLPKPDLIIFLYNSVNQVLSNIKKRGRSYEANIRPEYLDAIQKGYFDYFRGLTKSRIVVIDTQNLDFVGSPEDFKIISSIIMRTYSPGIHRIVP